MSEPVLTRHLVASLAADFGFSTDGLPLSVQFVGRRLSESVLCRIRITHCAAEIWRSEVAEREGFEPSKGF